MVARRPVALERWGEVAADWLSRRVPLLLERRGRRRSRFSGVRSDEEVVSPEEGDRLAAAPALPPVLGRPKMRVACCLPGSDGCSRVETMVVRMWAPR